MIVEKNYLEELKPYFNSYVTLGDGPRGTIKGIGRLTCPGLRTLDDVVLV